MLRLSRIFKNLRRDRFLSEQVNLYGFIGPQIFLTKTGEVGVILEVRGVDYECLDAASTDALTKRLESALKTLRRKLPRIPISVQAQTTRPSPTSSMATQS